jgi:hypothetical protein
VTGIFDTHYREWGKKNRPRRAYRDGISTIVRDSVTPAMRRTKMNFGSTFVLHSLSKRLSEIVIAVAASVKAFALSV